LNRLVKMPEVQDNKLMDLLKNRNNTKGVYWIGTITDYNKLIEKFDSVYSNSTDNTLTANGMVKTDLYVQVGNDKDKLYIGYVTKDIDANMDTK
jgi:hypothetical protein